MTINNIHRKAAITSGVALLLMAILAPVANFKLIYGLISIDDPLKTVANIVASESLFRLGIFLLMVVAILDIVVAWGLFALFKPVNKSLSLFSSLSRTVYAAVLIFALINLINVLYLLDRAGNLNTALITKQVMILISSFGSIWNLGMIMFSMHLFILGYLVFKSSFYPKFLGILIAIAAIGYIIDSLGKIIISNYSLTISSYTFVGEVLLIFWLLFKKNLITKY